MIDHERFLMLAAADVSGELNEAERAELESHVASCPSCRQEAARMWLDQRALVAASAEVPVPAATRAAVVAAIRQRPARARLRRWPGAPNRRAESRAPSVLSGFNSLCGQYL